MIWQELSMVEYYKILDIMEKPIHRNWVGLKNLTLTDMLKNDAKCNINANIGNLSKRRDQINKLNIWFREKFDYEIFILCDGRIGFETEEHAIYFRMKEIL